MKQNSCCEYHCNYNQDKETPAENIAAAGETWAWASLQKASVVLKDLQETLLQLLSIYVVC